jgi:hypothetical protein
MSHADHGMTISFEIRRGELRWHLCADVGPGSDGWKP